MKLTLDVPDDLYQQMIELARRKGHMPLQSFGGDAIERAVRDGERSGPVGIGEQMAKLISQTQRLETGQRAIVALLDSVAVMLTAGLHCPGARRLE